MITQVLATVVGGMLKPDRSLPLPEHTRVSLTIQPIGEHPEPAAAWEALKARLRNRPIHASGKHYTRDQLHERR
jgi:hypothetical protein